MLYMVTLKIHAGQRNKAIEEFEARGPNRTPGVAFRGTWVATHDDVVYALIDARDEPAAEQACQAWSDFGDGKICPVVDIDKY